MNKPIRSMKRAKLARTAKLKIPGRKLSETILDCVAPLIDLLDADQPIEVVREILYIVITVWNAHVLAMPAWNRPGSLIHLKSRLESEQAAPKFIQTYHELSQRRRTHFATDPRVVCAWSVAAASSGLRLYCAANLPPSRMLAGKLRVDFPDDDHAALYNR